MLFRYKITKSYECVGNTSLIHYDVTIQKYNPNGCVFKWQTCKDTTLKNITALLSNEYCFSAFDNALPEIAKTISQYGSVDRMISEYIWKIIIRDMKLENKMSDIEKSIDDIVLNNDWKTIEFKENE
jgi:hypothetical protein